MERFRRLGHQLDAAWSRHNYDEATFPALATEALEELATRLKKRCGSGGTVHAGVIEIQGDHRDVLVAELGKLGK